MPRPNRKHTRSRGRNRKSKSQRQSASLSNLTPFSPYLQTHVRSQSNSSNSYWYSSPHHWQLSSSSAAQPFSPFGNRSRQTTMNSASEVDAAQAERLRMFGGEEADGVTLCGPMLQVVLDLFDGGLDYADPE